MTSEQLVYYSAGKSASLEQADDEANFQRRQQGPPRSLCYQFPSMFSNISSPSVPVLPSCLSSPSPLLLLRTLCFTHLNKWKNLGFLGAWASEEVLHTTRVS